MKKQEITLADIPLPDTEIIERQVIADAVDNAEIVGDLISVVEKEMFTDEVRTYLWETIVYMFNNGDNIDLPTFVSKTGNYYLNEILTKNITPSTPATALQHAAELRCAHIKRKAYFEALGLLQDCVNPNTTEIAVYDKVQDIAGRVQEGNSTITEFSMVEVSKVVGEKVAKARTKRERGQMIRIPTGFPSINDLTFGGWEDSQLIILAARPSVGKTAFMLQMARASAGAGFPTTIFSLEMTKEELFQRMLVATSDITQRDLATGGVTDARYNQFAQPIASLPIYINDGSRKLESLISRLTIAVHRGRCKVAFIDYLGFIVGDETGRMPKAYEIAKITGELKAAAKKLGIPIILLAQINRDSAKDDRPPELFDIKDSGAVEQDADIAILLEKKKDNDLTQDGDKPQRINMWVRKNRNYKKDVMIPVVPNDTYTVFTEIIKEGSPLYRKSEDMPPAYPSSEF